MGPTVQEVSTQTKYTRKNVSVQFRSKHTLKGKLYFTYFARNVYLTFTQSWFSPELLNYFRRQKCSDILFTGIQKTIPTKSQGTQCTLLKDLFLSSTPCQSEDGLSDEEDMEADDDPSYAPDPDEDLDEGADFDDFDDCLYE